MVWYSHLFQNFPQFIVIHTVKGFGVVNKAKVDVFLELSCIFDDPADVGNLTSGSSAFSKSNLNIWKFTVHVLLKPNLENFELYIACVWDEYNYAVVWTLFGIAFIWDWNENWPFPVLWSLLSFTDLLVYWVQHLKQLHRIHRKYYPKEWNTNSLIKSKNTGMPSITILLSISSWVLINTIRWENEVNVIIGKEYVNTSLFWWYIYFW